MAVIKVTPEMMYNVSKEVDGKIQEWQQAVIKVYNLTAEMGAMWDGTANDAFNQSFQQDRSKYNLLAQTMTEYSTAIKQAASRYMQGEQEVAQIVSRKR